MKKIILLTTLFSCVAFAQMPPGFNAENMAKMEKNMQSMMAGMANVEQCMSQVDESAIEALGDKASKMEKVISSLCEQGKKSEAQNKAIQFSKEINNHSELLKMKKCMGPMAGMMNSMSFDEMYKDIESGKEHICSK